MANVQHISDTNGIPLGVFVPIDLWQEIESEKETAHLLKSEKMKERLLEAKKRDGGLSLDVIRAKLSI